MQDRLDKMYNRWETVDSVQLPMISYLNLDNSHQLKLPLTLFVVSKLAIQREISVTYTDKKTEISGFLSGFAT